MAPCAIVPEPGVSGERQRDESNLGSRGWGFGEAGQRVCGRHVAGGRSGLLGRRGFWRCTWGARVSCEQDAPSIESKKSQNGVKNESKKSQKKSQKRVKKESKKSSRPKKLKKSQNRVEIESKSSQNRVKIESKKKRPCSVEPPPSNLHEGCTGGALSCLAEKVLEPTFPRKGGGGSVLGLRERGERGVD